MATVFMMLSHHPENMKVLFSELKRKELTRVENRAKTNYLFVKRGWRRFKELLSEEFYGMFIRVVSEMFIKGECSFNPKLIYQSEAGAIGKT